MRIVVTAGAGFIGSHVADGLLAAGHDVLAIDDLSTGHRHNVPVGARFVELDFRDAPAVARLLCDFRPSVVCHQAVQSNLVADVGEPSSHADPNMLGSLALIEGCVRSGVETVVLGSKAGPIYGEIADPTLATELAPERPSGPSACSNLAVERYLAYCEHAHGLRSVILRHANVYGPRQDPRRQPGVVASFIERMLRNEPIQINARSRRGDDGCVRDYVFVGDVVRANIAALERRSEHRIINVCTGEPTSTRALTEHIRRLCGSRSSVCHASRRPGDLSRSVLDPSRFQVLGEPTSLNAGLASTVAWFEARGRHGDRIAA